MTTTENNQTTLESRLKETTEENELLLCQLHQVQEELERYYLRNKELEQAQPTALTNSAALTTCWADDELPDVLAENLNLRAVADVLRAVHHLESQNALNVRLGNILIQGVDSPGSLLSVPGKLGKIWRESSRQTPPEALGGKDYKKVIAAYQEGGFDAVENLLTAVAILPAMQANAYTALARFLMKVDQNATVDAARRAHALDPRPYRLKWLAFRLHEAGELVEAEAMLDVLPTGMEFSDSEARQVSRLRYEAKQARLRQARQKTHFAQRRAEVEKQLNTLARDRDTQSQLAAERGQAIESLKQAKAKLEQEKKTLADQLDDQKKLIQERGATLEALKQVQTRSEQELAMLTRRYGELEKLGAERGESVEALQQAKARLEMEKADLSARVGGLQDEKEEQQAELSLLLDQLHQVQEELERSFARDQEQKLEIAALTARYEEQTKITAERNQAVEAIQQAKTLQEQEKAALTRRHDEQAKLAAERGQALEALKQAKAQLEQDKAALSGRHDEQAKLAAERGQALEALKQAQAQLEQEKAALSRQHDEQAKLAAERQKQLAELQQRISSHLAAETTLSTRQQLLQDELVRAESQLDLIKDIFLREAGL